MKQSALVLGGAVLGGLLGYCGFFWLTQQGFYGLVLPGGLLGMGAGIAKCHSRWPSVICGISALALSLFTRWQFGHFEEDAGFIYFVKHVYQLSSVTLLMIAAGTAIGFWVPFRRVESDRGSSPQSSA